MNWSTIETSAESLFRTAANDATLQVRWKETADHNTYRAEADGLVLDLSVVSVVSTGRPERVLKDSGDGENLTEGVYGIRAFTMQLDAESFDQPYEATALLETIAAGVYSHQAAPTLQFMGLSVASVSAIRTVPYKDQGRQVNASVLEILFNAHTLLTFDDIPYVDRVSGEATYSPGPVILPFDSVLE